MTPMTKKEDTISKLKLKELLGINDKTEVMCFSEGLRKRTDFKINSPINIYNKKIVRAKWEGEKVVEEEKIENGKVEQVRNKLKNLGI
jgi:hypothetical protein